MHLRALVLTLALALCATAGAQDIDTVEQWLDRFADTDEISEEALEEMGEDIEDLYRAKINLNAMQYGDLERLPFLTAKQADDIYDYVARHAPLRSVEELYLVESLTREAIRLLLHFVYVGDVPQKAFSVKDMLRYGRHELTAYGRVPCYRRRGDGDRNGLLGPPYKHWLRYTFNYRQRVKLGLIGAQDAGEPFFYGRNTQGYDYYSYYLLLQNFGRLKAAALGRYRLKTGMGLVLNNDLLLGKSFALTSLVRRDPTLRGHISRRQDGYLQGAAATVALTRSLDLTAFVSRRHIDATLTPDSLGVRTIITSGYHRTPTDMAKKGNTAQTAFGGHLHYTHGAFFAGLTALRVSFSRPLLPDTAALYRRRAPMGSCFWNASVNYGYTGGRLTVAGETATCDTHAWATINTVAYRTRASLTLRLIQRYYSPRYNALMGNSFSEGRQVKNENGVYLGAEWAPSPGLNITAYADYASFAEARYRCAEPSHAFDARATALWQHRALTLSASYRLRLRQENNQWVGDQRIEDEHSNLLTAVVWPKDEHQARLTADWHAGPWQLRAQGDLHRCFTHVTSDGYMLSARGGYKAAAWQLYASCGYFHTDDFNSRIYLYERATLYDFASPSFSGRGLRLTLWARADLFGRLAAICRVGCTKYFDRTHISSGLMQIDHSAQTDIDMQLRWKF